MTLSLQPDIGGSRTDGGAIIVLLEAPIVVQASQDFQLSSSAAISIHPRASSPRPYRPPRAGGGGGQHRSIVRLGGGGDVGRAPSWSTIGYPDLLLAPGALESIVMNNGTYLTTNSLGGDLHRGRRSARRHAREGGRRIGAINSGTGGDDARREGLSQQAQDSAAVGKASFGALYVASHR